MRRGLRQILLAATMGFSAPIAEAHDISTPVATTTGTNIAQQKLPRLHGSDQGLKPLKPYLKIFQMLGHPVTDIVVMNREDLLSPQEIAKEERTTALGGIQSIKYEYGESEKRVGDFLTLHAQKLPQAYKEQYGLKSFGLRDGLFRAAITNRPEVRYISDDQGNNMCLVAAPVWNTPARTFLSLFSHLPEGLIEKHTLPLGLKGQYLFTMAHEIRHCAQDHSHYGDDKVHNSLSTLSKEVDADNAAYYIMRYLFRDQKQKVEQFIEAIQHARIIGTIRDSKNLDKSNRDFISHAYDPLGKNKPSAAADIMLGAAMVNTALHNILGRSMTKPEVLKLENGAIDQFFKFRVPVERINPVNVEKRKAYADRAPSEFGEYVAREYPLLEYATMRAVRDRLVEIEKREKAETKLPVQPPFVTEKSSGKQKSVVLQNSLTNAFSSALPPIAPLPEPLQNRKMMLAMANDFIKAFEYLVPSATRNPLVEVQMKEAKDVMERFPGLVISGHTILKSHQMFLGDEKGGEALLRSLSRPVPSLSQELTIPKL